MSEQEFTIGQQVRITRNETWHGRICTILYRSEEEPDMYYLHPHGWRRNDEIEAVPMEVSHDARMDQAPRMG